MGFGHHGQARFGWCQFNDVFRKYISTHPIRAIMPAAGFAAATGQMNYLPSSLLAQLAQSFGALPLYYIGTKLDKARLIHLTNRYGKYF